MSSITAQTDRLQRLQRTRSGCPGVRKSVRFPLKAGDFSIQLSNIEGPAINIAVVPAP